MIGNLNKSIASRFIFFTIFLSSIITVLLTGIQILSDYSKEINQIDHILEKIEAGYIPSLQEAVWNFEEKQVDLILNGISSQPNILSAKVITEEQQEYSRGDFSHKPDMTHQFKLTYTKRPGLRRELGELTVGITLEEVYDVLLSRFFLVLLSNFVKTFLVSSIMFFLFHKMVGRRISKLVAFTRNIAKGDYSSLIKERKHFSTSSKDELGILIQNFNLMAQAREKAETNLKKSEANWRSFSRCSADIILVIEGNGTVTFMNHELPSTTPKKAIGTSLYNFTDDKFHKDMKEAFQKVLTTNKFSRYEVEYKNKLGEVRYYSAHVGPLEDPDTPQKLIINLHDMTDKKLLLKELNLAKTKAESANRTKTSFIANMSHELRTPLNAVIGFSDLMLIPENDYSPKEREDFIKRISNSGKHLLNLVNDLLDVSMIELGKIQIDITTFDLTDLISQSIHTNKIVADDKKITIITPDEQSSPTHIKGDMNRVQQIINNLLVNALKFTPEGGQVGVEVSHDEDNVIITVWDNGIGISPEHISQIFTPFGQVENSLSRQYGGAGLGLAICKKLVDLHNGEIWVKSDLHKGSRFSFSIPQNLT